jgi:hypothetical protein
MSFTRTSQLIAYTVALVALLFVPGWSPARLIVIVGFALMILIVIFAPRIGGQCCKCDSVSDVLYGYRCPKCRKRRER